MMLMFSVTEIVPVVGAMWLAISFVRVLLPLPLRPFIQRRVPVRIVRLSGCAHRFLLLRLMFRFLASTMVFPLGRCELTRFRLREI